MAEWAKAAVLVLTICPTAAVAQPASPVATFVVRNWTRVESWRYFEPPAGGGDPSYVDVANRLLLGVERHARRYDLAGSLQYVQFGNLPMHANGPGALGAGGSYFDHARRTDPRQVYLRYLYVRLFNTPRTLSVQVGRVGYASGAESPSGNPEIEALKRQRLDSRMVGEFEWALFQRAFDGIRVDLDRRAVHFSASALRPTQGGFEESAGVEIDRVNLLIGTATLKPGSVFRHADWQLFAYRYDDSRATAARPDNTNLPAPAVDIHINTFGTSIVGVIPREARRIDLVGWLAAQAGTWYRQPHRAFASAAELGCQWPKAAWHPWVRAGWFYASGDRDGADGRHGTFFPMVPTVRKYSFSTIYSLMNLNDVFVQTIVRPVSRLNARVDVHRLSLATAQDRWYSGSGATQKRGAIFGYAGRRSNGATSLGLMIEGATDYVLTPHWSVNAYLGVMKGGGVVRRTFVNDRLVFAYVENVLQR